MKIKQKVKSLLSDFIHWRVAYRQFKKNKKILNRIKAIKDMHKGKRCFIIGTGPSLTIDDLNLLKGEITFGTNRIYELFDKTDWRPTYYVNQDHSLIKKYSDSIKEVNSKCKFLPIDYEDVFYGDEYLFFVLKHKDFYPSQSPFSHNLYRFLAQGFTVTYGAIQIAMYMGFKEIYLLGIDHNYEVTRDSKGNVIRKNVSNSASYAKGITEYTDLANLPRVEETTIAYETAELISKKRGVRIYNVTRGGKLEAFERKNLEEVIIK